MMDGCQRMIKVGWMLKDGWMRKNDQGWMDVKLNEQNELKTLNQF